MSYIEVMLMKNRYKEMCDDRNLEVSKFWSNVDKNGGLSKGIVALIIWYCIGAAMRRKKSYNRGATFHKSTSSSFPRQKSTFEDQKSIIVTTTYNHGAIFKKSASSSPLSYKSTFEVQKST